MSSESSPLVAPLEDCDTDALGAVLAQCFAFKPENARTWFASAGVGNVRAVHLDGRVAGGLLLLPMGQFFGGRRVAMTGVAGVGVAPELRGRGLAGELMRSVVREMRESGTPISTLFPATLPLYRSVGYEIAGATYEARLRPGSIGLRERAPGMRPATDADASAIRRVYAQVAAGRDGHLDRSEYVWRRVTHAMASGEPAPAHVVEGDDGIDGYVILTRDRNAQGRQEMRVLDLLARTPVAWRRLLSFLADHHSLTDAIDWRGAPCALPLQLPEVGWKWRMHWPWAVRILDVAKALGARGYPEGVRAELHFEVRDELLPANAGRYVLEVGEGRGTPEPGGEGRLRCDVRGLAPLYAGFASPASLVAAGLLEGRVADLRAAAAVFAGPAPSMADMF